MSGIASALDLVSEVQKEVSKYTGHQYAIAGGCIRDAFFGKPLKDIDLVVYCERQWEHLTDWPEVNEYGPTGEFMAGSTSIQVLNKYPVQLIWRPGEVSAKEMMRYHSLAVSNFFFIDGVFIIDPQALKDYREKLHTLNRKRWAVDTIGSVRLEKYVKKIQKKYPWPIRET